MFSQCGRTSELRRFKCVERIIWNSNCDFVLLTRLYQDQNRPLKDSIRKKYGKHVKRFWEIRKKWNGLVTGVILDSLHYFPQ